MRINLEPFGSLESTHVKAVIRPCWPTDIYCFIRVKCNCRTYTIFVHKFDYSERILSEDRGKMRLRCAFFDDGRIFGIRRAMHNCSSIHRSAIIVYLEVSPIVKLWWIALCHYFEVVDYDLRVNKPRFPSRFGCSWFLIRYGRPDMVPLKWFRF